jgi:hypothetical protein
VLVARGFDQPNVHRQAVIEIDWQAAYFLSQQVETLALLMRRFVTQIVQRQR